MAEPGVAPQRGCCSLAQGLNLSAPQHCPSASPQAHIQILYGNLAPEGSVAKITGKEGLHFEGKVRPSRPPPPPAPLGLGTPCAARAAEAQRCCVARCCHRQARDGCSNTGPPSQLQSTGSKRAIPTLVKPRSNPVKPSTRPFALIARRTCWRRWPRTLPNSRAPLLSSATRVPRWEGQKAVGGGPSPLASGSLIRGQGAEGVAGLFVPHYLLAYPRLSLTLCNGLCTVLV